MELRKVGYSLGALSLALGAAELLAGDRIARRLGVKDHSGKLRAFGLRELATGAALIANPTASKNVWGRVAGDIMDLAALGAAFREAEGHRRALWASVAFVAGALVADIAAGVAMDRQPDLV